MNTAVIVVAEGVQGLLAPQMGEQVDDSAVWNGFIGCLTDPTLHQKVSARSRRLALGWHPLRIRGGVLRCVATVQSLFARARPRVCSDNLRASPCPPSRYQLLTVDHEAVTGFWSFARTTNFHDRLETAQDALRLARTGAQVLPALGTSMKMGYIRAASQLCNWLAAAAIRSKVDVVKRAQLQKSWEALVAYPLGGLEKQQADLGAKLQFAAETLTTCARRAIVQVERHHQPSTRTAGPPDPHSAEDVVRAKGLIARFVCSGAIASFRRRCFAVSCDGLGCCDHRGRSAAAGEVLACSFACLLVRSGLMQLLKAVGGTRRCTGRRDRHGQALELNVRGRHARVASRAAHLWSKC